MCDPIRTLALAQRFRRDAQQTQQLEFARLMLHAAEELEALVRSQEGTSSAHSGQRKAG
jgi:hypothetical protein